MILSKIIGFNLINKLNKDRPTVSFNTYAFFLSCTYSAEEGNVRIGHAITHHFHDTRDQSSSPEWTSKCELVFRAKLRHSRTSHRVRSLHKYIYFEEETHLCSQHLIS